MPIRKWLRYALRKLTGSTVVNPRTADGDPQSKFQVFKRHPTGSVCEGLGPIVANEKLALPAAVHQLIEDRREELKRSLSGALKETSYRHKLTKLDAGFVFKEVSSSDRALALLYSIALWRRPGWTLELGSAFGMASLCLASATGKSENARFDGVEFEDWRAEIASAGVERILPGKARVHPGDINVLVPKLISESGRRVDLAFVDAMHTREACHAYHKVLSPGFGKSSVVVYDDINWSPDMRQFWSDLVEQPNVIEAVLVDGRWGIVEVVGP